MRDWFAGFAERQHQESGQPWATRATDAERPPESVGIRKPPISSQLGNGRAIVGNQPEPLAQVAQGLPNSAKDAASQETAENSGLLSPVAPVALVAHENDEVVREPDSSAWDAADWREYFDERAGIAEYDTGLTRAEAEKQAFECCVVRWLRLNPAPRPDLGLCANCGRPLDEVGGRDIPVLNGDSEPIRLHRSCQAPWRQSRRKEAIRALSASIL
jgi:hypothetical protein